MDDHDPWCGQFAALVRLGAFYIFRSRELMMSEGTSRKPSLFCEFKKLLVSAANHGEVSHNDVDGLLAAIHVMAGRRSITGVDPFERTAAAATIREAGKPRLARALERIRTGATNAP